MYPASYWKKSVGQWFGSKYLLKAFLGCGAYGAVFQADEMIAERIIQTVAIKIVIVDLERLDQQIEELQLAVRLRHPHLINGITCEQGDINGDLCIGLVMELADDSLENYLKVNKPPLAVEFVSTLVEHLAEGLTYIHGQGIIHRDLKPANILRVGESWKLADFGIARSLEDGTSTYTTKQIGSPAYMPPESYYGKISSAWDVWSLGVIIHDLLSNQHPFPTQIEAELMRMVLNEEPALAKNLASPFKTIIENCLVKDPNVRWKMEQILFSLSSENSDTRITLLLQRVEALESLKKYEQALEVCNQLLDIKIDNAEIWFKHGKTLAQLERYEDAISSYEQSIEIDPLYIKAWHNRGICLSDLKRLDSGKFSRWVGREKKIGHRIPKSAVMSETG